MERERETIQCRDAVVLTVIVKCIMSLAPWTSFLFLNNFQEDGKGKEMFVINSLSTTWYTIRKEWGLEKGWVMITMKFKWKKGRNGLNVGQ